MRVTGKKRNRSISETPCGLGGRLQSLCTVVPLVASCYCSSIAVPLPLLLPLFKKPSHYNKYNEAFLFTNLRDLAQVPSRRVAASHRSRALSAADRIADAPCRSECALACACQL